MGLTACVRRAVADLSTIGLCLSLILSNFPLGWLRRRPGVPRAVYLLRAQRLDRRQYLQVPRVRWPE